MPYCMYLRKSRADRELEAIGAGETLERHRKALYTLSAKLKLQVDEVYMEIVSGETISQRPQMQRLLEDVKEGLWEGVFVMEVERLARGDTVDQGTIANVFKIHGTKIITPAKIYDPNDEFDEEYFEFGLFMSRREYKTINRRIQRGRIASVKEGKFIGSTPPFGYDKIKSPDGKGYILTPNLEEAPIVRQIYELYLSGNGSFTIANIITGQGVRPRTNTAWSPSSIRDILKNPVYAGLIRWSYKKEIKEMKNGVMHKKRSKSPNCILVQGKHTALVSKEDFDKVQSLLKRKNKNTTRHDRTLKNPLSGLIYCKECGKLMNRVGENTHLGYATLTCKTLGCVTVASPLELVENKLMEILREYYNNYNLYFKQKTKEENKISNATIRTLEKRLAAINTQMDNTYSLLEQGVYTVEVFTERQKKLGADKKDTELQLEKAREAQAQAEKIKLPTKGELGTVLSLYDKAQTAEAKNALLKGIVKRVEYSKTIANTRGKANNINFTLDVYLSL